MERHEVAHGSGLDWLSAGSTGRYYTLGSGFTDGYSQGASVALFNCHTLHGSISRVRIWDAPISNIEQVGSRLLPCC